MKVHSKGAELLSPPLTEVTLTLYRQMYQSLLSAGPHPSQYAQIMGRR